MRPTNGPASSEFREVLDCGAAAPLSERATTIKNLLGEVETLARTPFDELQAPYGPVRLVSPEDLLVERVLISAYPHRYEPAEMCARKLIAVGLSGQVEMDWSEVRRLAARPEYDILSALEKLVGDIAHELGKQSPYHS